MRLISLLKYTGLFVFGYFLLLSIPYYSYLLEDYTYQALFTILTGILLWLFIKVILILHDKYGDAPVFLGVWFFGGAIRFLWAIFVQTQPFSDFMEFHESALLLSQGIAAATKNIGYALSLAAAYRLYPDVLSGKLLNAVASTVTILLIYLIGSKLGNQRTGLVASFLFALLPSEVLMVSVLGTEVLATTLGVTAAFFILHSTGVQFKISVISIFLAGLFFGLALTVRSSYIIYIPAIVVGGVLAARPLHFKQMGISFISLFAGMVMGLLLILANYSLSTNVPISFAPFKNQSSYPLLSGTNIENIGKYNRDDAELYLSWDPDKRDRLAREEALNRIRTNPGGFLGMIPQKMAILMRSDDYASYWSIFELDWGRVYIFISMLSQSIYVFILYFAFNAFMDFDYKNYSLHLFVLILISLTCFLHVFFEVQPRYHHYIMPYIVLLSSIGILQNIKTSGSIHDVQTS